MDGEERRMSNDLLWDCSNDYDTEVRYRKGTTIASANQGVCAGLAIEWCKNILKGTRVELTKPFLLQGMLYQRFYDWGTSDADANSKLFGTAGVTAGRLSRHTTAHTTAEHIWPKTGAWWGGLQQPCRRLCQGRHVAVAVL
jgi:hypothetical protein